MIVGKLEKKFKDIGKYTGDLFDPGIFKSYMRHGKGIMEYLNGEKYDGNWNMNDRHGFGIMKYKNGDFYSGNWENDKKNGPGNLTYHNGEKIIINWKDDNVSGKGIKYYLNGDKYDGEFLLNGLRNGEGIYIYKNGDKFKGTWSNDMKNGNGQIIFDNKYIASGVWVSDKIIGTLFFEGEKYEYNTIETDEGVYDGLLKNNKFNGFGRFYFKNGSIYKGIWINGEQEGNGNFINQEGDIFEGEFNKGKFINGKLLQKNGDIYLGNFNNYEPIGTIEVCYKNGDNYKGEIKNWKKNSYGELKTKDGNEYKGEFLNDIKNGKGILKTSLFQYEGEFKNDKFNGLGTIIYKDYIYKGSWINGMKNGSGEITYENGTILNSNFIEDKIDGKVQCIYSDSSVYVGFWNKNYASGQGYLKYANGDIYEGSFNYGQKSGIGKMIYKDKSIYDGTWYNDFKVNGILLIPDGTKYEGFFNYSQMIEKGRVFFPNGDKYNGDFLNNNLDGFGSMKYNNGNIYEGNWKDNKPNGKGKMIFSNGDIYVGSWKNGKYTMGNWKIESIDKSLIASNKKILDNSIKSWSNIYNFQVFNNNSKIIEQFYDNFINLTYSSREISCLRQNSSNGFIRFVEFNKLGNRIKLILKSTILDKEGFGDNLLYEYLVGKCVNSFCNYFPNFIKTYASYQYKNQSKYDFLLNSCSKLSKTILPDNLEYYLYVNSFENLNDNIINGCKNNKYMSVLTQFVPYEYDLRSYVDLMLNRKIFQTKNITELIKILYMIYAPLKVLCNHYTHYDLHDKNILLYEIPNNQYIDIKYYKNDIDFILIKTKYIPIIIDYGRSWIDCKFFDKELLNSNEILNIVCDNVNECKSSCGKEVGFEFIGNRNGRDFLDTDHNKFYINTAKRNKSHDLRLLNSFKKYDYRNLDNKIEYIQNWLFLLDNLIYNNEFGTPEININSQSKIVNVETATNALESIILSSGFDTHSNDDIISLIKYSTMNIYLYELKNRTIE